MVKSIFIRIISSISKNSGYHKFKCKYEVLLSKAFLFQAIQFNQTVIIQTIQFSISINFVYKKLNLKTVQFQKIQFNVSKVSMSKILLLKTI